MAASHSTAGWAHKAPGQAADLGRRWSARRGVHCKIVAAVQDNFCNSCLVRLGETDVVRITKEDIVLETGGDFSDAMLRFMNEALATYKFKVEAIHGKWFVCDGRFRLFRFIDGLVIRGAAKEKLSERVWGGAE